MANCDQETPNMTQLTSQEAFNLDTRKINDSSVTQKQSQSELSAQPVYKTQPIFPQIIFSTEVYQGLIPSFHENISLTQINVIQQNVTHQNYQINEQEIKIIQVINQLCQNCRQSQLYVQKISTPV